MLRSGTIGLVAGALARIAVGVELPRIPGAVGAPDGERRCGHNHHHRRRKQGYGKNQKYTPHYFDLLFSVQKMGSLYT
jgi:hypothetical protein